MAPFDPHHSVDFAKGICSRPDLGSFLVRPQSIFFKVMNSDTGQAEIAKVYRPMDAETLGVRIDPDHPNPVLARELVCLKSLSPGLNPRIEVMISFNGERTSALVTRELNPGDFLNQRIFRGERLDSELLQKLANKLAAFHFDKDISVLEIGKLSLFIRERVLGWEQTLLLDPTRNFDIDSDKVLRWFSVVRRQIDNNFKIVDLVGEVLSEPIRGHGAICSENIAFTDSGEVFVVGTATYRPWQTTTRRMDAAAFYTELLILDRDDEAKIFLDCYDQQYLEGCGKRFVSFNHAFMKKGGALLDAVTLFYRLVNFYRLSFQGVHPDRRQRTIDLIDELVAKLEGRPSKQ